ncbi:hypothetical protein [Paracoccus sp. pheM1]|uniref:hypothetical protein n=1 Tax=Paracoccus sp. pheM1 TaxID=2831675 RepID=UPI001BDB7A38|nr:hypothetical protein [Paracoccus sp. pheM1]MBT0779997.1 hypothetical protein [Paracoccus sp. pheM1]
MVFARYALVLLGLVLCGLGVAQVQPGVPGLFRPRPCPRPWLCRDRMRLTSCWAWAG